MHEVDSAIHHTPVRTYSAHTENSMIQTSIVESFDVKSLTPQWQIQTFKKEGSFLRYNY